MRVDPKAVAHILVSAAQNGSSQEKMHVLTKGVVEFLVEKNAMHLWREVAKEIERQWKDTFGASTVAVESAYPLDSDTTKQIEALAKGADIHTNINPELIGGIKIQIDDTVIDSTVSGKLAKMKQAFERIS